MAKKIVFRIDGKTGAATIKPEGYKGEECFTKTKGLEDGLGMKGQCELTPENFESPEQNKEQEHN